MTKINFVDHTGETRTVDVENGSTVMETAIRNAVPGIEAECGGACACATCHVYVDEAWREKVGEPSPMEEDMLDFAFDVRPNSRLSCQIKVTRRTRRAGRHDAGAAGLRPSIVRKRRAHDPDLARLRRCDATVDHCAGRWHKLNCYSRSHKRVTAITSVRKPTCLAATFATDTDATMSERSRPTSSSSARARAACSPCSNSACSTSRRISSTSSTSPAGSAPSSIRKSRSTTFPASRSSPGRA